MPTTRIPVNYGVPISRVYTQATDPGAVPDGSLWVPSAPASQIGLGAHSFGPDGTRWLEFVPGLDQPAQRTAESTGDLIGTQLPAAVAAAADGSLQVIEVVGDLLGAVTVPQIAGADTIPNNVLVRPALGARAGIQYNDILCDRIAFAGFDWREGLHTASRWQVRGNRSGWLQCVADAAPGDDYAPLINLKATDGSVTDDQFTVECVQPYWCFNKSTPWNVHYYAAASPSQNRRSLTWGGYFAAKIPGIYVDPTWGSGAFSNPGQPIDFYQTGTLPAIGDTFAVETVAGAVNYSTGTPGAAIMLWVDFSKADEPAETIELYIDDVLWQTVTLDQTIEHRHRKVRGNVDDATVKRNWLGGEVVTAKRIAGGDSARGLHIMYGVDASEGVGGTTAAGPDVHDHNFQAFAAGSDRVVDAIFRESVWGPSGITFQIEAARGDWVWDTNFISRPPGSAHIFGADPDGHTDLMEYAIGNQFQGSQTVNSTTAYPVFMHNRGPSFTGDHTLDPSNTTVAAEPTPDLADLTAAWTRHPYTKKPVP